MPRRSDHPGVYLFTRKRSKSVTHYARWKHPWDRDEHGRPVMVETNLSALGLSQKPDRIRWAKRKSRELIEAGRGDSLPIDMAFDRAAAASELGSWARGDYKRALDHFVKVTGVERTDQINRQALDAYREALASSRYAARSRNSRLRRVAALLQRWRAAELCPLLSKDAINDRLASFATRRPKPKPLTRGELAELPRHPFVLFVLLSGMRKGEALGFSAGWLSFDRGTITVPPETKTNRGRIIDLSVSPMLVDVLRSDLGTIEGMTDGKARWLRKKHDALWTWQNLRQTCGSYLVNSTLLPPWRAAEQLGHSPQVARDFYYRVITTIPEGVSSLEEAMGLTSQPRAEPAKDRK